MTDPTTPSDEPASTAGDTAGAGTPAEGPRAPISSDAARELLARLKGSERFGRYGDLQLVGRGGMGAVYAATDSEIGRRVAMKVLEVRDATAAEPPELQADRVRRFLAEAQVMGQLDHPGIVPVHELGVDDRGRVYFTMKLVRGRTLTEVLGLALDGRDGWTQLRVLGVLLRICEALAFAHARGVIHRDLKPDNVMVGRFGEAYVMDWGLARVAAGAEGRITPGRVPPSSVLHTVRDTPDGAGSPLVTAEGAVVGTPSYMAPEQAAGHVVDLSPRVDVYSVGAILYEVLTGRAPYVGAASPTPRAIVDLVRSGPPTPVRELAPNAAEDLVAICEKAMARRLDHRYPTVEACAADIEAYLDRRPVAARSSGALHALRLGIVRNRAVAATSAIALVVLAVFALWFARRLGETRRAAQQVADLMTAEALVDEEAATLVPRDPLRAGEVRRWLQRTDDLLARVAMADPGPRSAALSPGEWDRLDAKIAKLRERSHHVRSEVQMASAFVRAPEGLLGERWQSVFTHLANDSRFASLDRVAQPALLPLRRNEAGCWLFLLLGTGEEPRFDANGTFRVDVETGIVFALLPAGATEVGWSDGEANEVVRTVDLAPFLLATHETTQAQWRRVMGEDPARRQAGVDLFSVPFGDLNPVESITWYEAARFAAVVTARLPGEYEFEYAGRAGHPGDPRYDGRTMGELAGFENLRDRTYALTKEGGAAVEWDDGYPEHAPVGIFRANSLGLCDVGGNVSEWTADFYGREEPARLGIADEGRPDRLRLRVIRGSNWGEPGKVIRASYRKYQRPDYSTHWVGVRLARTWMSGRQVAAAAAAANTGR